MRRLIFENVFQDYEFLDRKEELFNFLYSIGMDSNSDKSYADINKDGEKDTLMVHFNMGSVTVYVGLCNFSNGEFKYLLYVKSSEGIVLKPTFFDSVEEIENNVSPYIETAYDDTKLSYLGIENEKEYMPSKSEYNDMLNSAIDSQDWEEVRRIQNKYGKLYESMKKIIRLTESDLTRLIKRVIKESADDGEIDMSNLPNEIKDFVLRYGNVSSDATDEEIMDDLYSLRGSEDRNISRQAVRLTRRL
jgi:hypothetical protein